MTVTAVPIQPLKKGSVVKLWVGIAILVLLAAAAAWWTTGGLHFTTTASGLQYRVVEEGEGPHPGATDLALINYTGRLEDGTVFDSNEGGQPVPLPVNGSIPGFSEALQLMSKGATYHLRIPPNLGYGAAGAGGVIPPNATLEFDVTLVDFRALTPEQLQQLQMMQMMQQQGAAGGMPGGEAGGAAPPGGAAPSGAEAPGRPDGASPPEPRTPPGNSAR